MFWANTLLLVFLAPVYEEMVFRGYLFSGLLQVFKGNIYWSALTTSFVFAILHTQYSDIRTLVGVATVDCCTHFVEGSGYAGTATYADEWLYHGNWLLLFIAPALKTRHPSISLS